MVAKTADDRFESISKVFSIKNKSRLELISARQEAERIVSLGSSKCYIREGVLYIPKDVSDSNQSQIVLLRNSPILDNPELAAQQSESKSDFYVKLSDIVEHLKDSVDLPLDRLKENHPLGGTYYPLKTSNLSKDVVGRWLFQGFESEFKDYLLKKGIGEIKINVLAPNYFNGLKYSFVRQLIFEDKNFNFSLDGTTFSLDKGYRPFRLVEKD